MEKILPRVVRVPDSKEVVFLEASAGTFKRIVSCAMGACVFNRLGECGYAKSPNLSTMSTDQKLPPSRTGREICPAGVHFAGGTTRHA